MSKKLPITEDLDFHYLLGLMTPLKSEPKFAWLPELFSIIGHEKLIDLCKYAGGEIIKLPTIEELADSIEALQMYYNVYVKKIKTELEIPLNLKESVNCIKVVYDAADD